MIKRFWLLLLVAIAFSSAAAAQSRVGVLTMKPGEVFFERFGHNAILVDYDDERGMVSYNFGYFDLDEPDFYGRFVFGQMRYRLVALPVESDLYWYRQSGRGVRVQWLNLSQEQMRSLADTLAENAREPNAIYDYRYFTNNCSTKVRDALDEATSGLLKRALSSRSRGNTYRTESVRLGWPTAGMGIGFHLGLARSADKALSRWDEAFVPMSLEESLREIRLADGQPLVTSESEVLPHRLPEALPEMPQWRLRALVLGLLMGGIVLASGQRFARSTAVFAGAFWLISGALGSVLIFLWAFTEHRFAHGNQNLLLLNPIGLILLAAAWQRLRSKPVSAWLHWLMTANLIGVLIAAFMKLLPFAIQQNTEWVLLLVPIHWALSRWLRAEPALADKPQPAAS